MDQGHVPRVYPLTISQIGMGPAGAETCAVASNGSFFSARKKLRFVVDERSCGIEKENERMNELDELRINE